MCSKDVLIVYKVQIFKKKKMKFWYNMEIRRIWVQYDNTIMENVPNRHIVNIDFLSRKCDIDK
jgi:hypothetical protein